MTTALDIRGLHVSRGGQRVLHDVSLTVPLNHTVAVLGPNGAGKSTLLRTVSGLHRPRSGSISVYGRPIHRSSPRLITKAGVAHVPEGREVFGRMTVQENLEMGGFTRRAGDTRRAVEEALELFPALASRRRQHAGLLSGGEQQMLAIGRALVSRPSVLLLDEPSMGLAPTIVADVGRAVRRISDEGATVLMVEQHVHLAMELADRVAVLVNGRIVADGAVEEFGSHEELAATYLSSSADHASIHSGPKQERIS